MNVKDDPFSGYNLLRKSLGELGYSVAARKNKDGKLVATFTSPEGTVWETRAGGLKYPFNGDHTERYSVNKDLAYELAKKENVPIPFTMLAKLNVNNSKLEAVLKRHSPLVVKPTNSSLSKGVVLNIKTLAQLKEAVTKAGAISDPVLIQEQVEGEEVRIVILKGNFECALLRRTARVIGDGKLTLSELISKENKLRAKLRFEYINYPQLDALTVRETAVKSGRTPQKDEVVELNRSTMISGGCSVYNVTEQIDAGYIKIAKKLAEKIGAGFLAVDIFCGDFTASPTPNNYRFIEFNKAPALKLFYSCRDGKTVDIIPRLTKAIDETLSKK